MWKQDIETIYIGWPIYAAVIHVCVSAWVYCPAIFHYTSLVVLKSWGLLNYHLQNIQFTVKEFKFDETQACFKNQLIIYEGKIADDTIRQEYCREKDVMTMQDHTFSAENGIGFRFWSERTTTKISFKICYEFLGEYNVSIVPLI